MSATDDRQDGYESAKRWIVDAGSETERANLAALFSGGETVLSLHHDTFPTLAAALDAHREHDSLDVDFASSPWLKGFRDAIVEELSEPG